MPSSHYWLVASLALAGLALPVLAQDPGVPVPTPFMAEAETDDAKATPLTRTAVEDIVRRTLAASCCQDCCCPAAPSCCWELAAEVTFLQPRFDHFTNGEFLTGLQVNQNSESSTVQEPQFDLEAGWRIWLGFVGPSGFGGRVRYWRLDADSETLSFAEPNFIERSSLGISLEMDVVDVEALFRRDYDLWIVQVGVGVRYARLERLLQFTNENEVSAFEELSRLKSAFEGVGPTLALVGRRSIAGGLAAIVNTRASLLAGRTVFRQEDTITFNSNPPQQFLATEETDNSLFVLETQIGLEYARPVGAFEFFARALFEAQYWFDAGHVIGQGEDTGFRRDLGFGEHANLGLVGCTLAAGVRR